MEGVGETQITVAIGFKAISVVAGVVHVLLADELGDETDVEAEATADLDLSATP